MTETLTQMVGRLRAVAERATPGPWQQTQNMKTGVKLWGADGSPLFAPIHGVKQSLITPDDPTPQWQKDCDFVRACSPDTILALCAAVENASANTDAALRAARDSFVTATERLERVEADNARLRAALAHATESCGGDPQ